MIAQQQQHSITTTNNNSNNVNKTYHDIHHHPKNIPTTLTSQLPTAKPTTKNQTTKPTVSSLHDAPRGLMCMWIRSPSRLCHNTKMKRCLTTTLHLLLIAGACGSLVSAFSSSSLPQSLPNNFPAIQTT